MMITLRWKEQTISLLPEKALWWHERRTVVITDPHFGKSAFFRSKGVPVPRGVTDADLARLDRILQETRGERLVILGDFLHARGGRARGTLRSIKRWRDAHASLDILLIRGNHDRKAGDPPRSWKFRCVNNGFVDEPFVFSHEPEPSKAGYVLTGHIHPAVVVRDEDGASLRMPCFSFSRDLAILPAFGGFTGCWTITPATDDRIFAIAPGTVIEMR
jgi:uncharacterized protein